MAVFVIFYMYNTRVNMNIRVLITLLMSVSPQDDEFEDKQEIKLCTESQFNSLRAVPIEVE